MNQTRAEWKRFHSGDRHAAARIIHPAHESGDLILFCPGFPGGGASLFEQRHASQIIAENFVLAVLRHNGTFLDGAFAEEMLNSSQFPKAVPSALDRWIGGKPARFADWLMEPQTVLEDIATAFTNIYLIGHSFGCLAALNALANLNENGHPAMGRVKSCLCLAPALGTLEGDDANNVMHLWGDDALNDPSVLERVDLADGPEFARAILREVYETLPDRVVALPPQLDLIFVQVAHDEIVREKDVRNFMTACGRGRFVLDEIDHPMRGHHPVNAHDMPIYPTELLLEQIEPQTVLTNVNKLF